MTSSPVVLSREQAKQLEIRAWDRIAPRRAADLDANRDPSYNHVLVPAIQQLIGRRPRHVLDAGCGVGRLTLELARKSGSVVAIDPSAVSAELARHHVRSRANVNVHDLSIEQYAGLGYNGHDCCVALMVMQDVVDLDAFLAAARKVLDPRGQIVAAITNPKYWPKYWGYENAPWFDYEKEIFIRSEFRTSLSSSGISTLHVHRPKTMYLSALTKAGFGEIESWEPMMPESIQRRSGVSWDYPHFWIVRGRAV